MKVFVGLRSCPLRATSVRSLLALTTPRLSGGAEQQGNNTGEKHTELKVKNSEKTIQKSTTKTTDKKSETKSEARHGSHDE